MTAPDPAFDAWQERARGSDILDVATRLCGAALKGRGRERMGPCPRCGGTDRFSVNTQKQLFNCRGAAGGSAIDLVMHCHAVPYLAACEIITGEPPPAKGTQLTDAARAAADALKAESRARAERRAADEQRYRAEERARSAEILANAHPYAGSSAADYVARRGLTFPPTPEGRAERIKCVEALPYVVNRGKDATGRDIHEVVHTGPALVIPIVDAGRRHRGAHITWLDLAEPKGKLKRNDPKTGESLDPKKTRGSVLGNRCELIGPKEPVRLVLGEGFEKTVAVWMALDWQSLAGERPAGDIPLEQTAFWSACNLGNLAGPHKGTVAHPTLTGKGGRPLRVAGPEPDLDKPGIAMPESVTDLVLLGDSTSDPFTTQLAMCRAAARYAKPGRTVRVAWAPAGKDFDDLWREAETDEARAEAAATIATIVSQAQPPEMPESPAAAPARDSAPHGAAKVGPQQTGAGNAGAPVGLPVPDTGPDIGDPSRDPSEAALGPAPPPAAPAATAQDQSANSSRSGASHKSVDRGRWGGPPRQYGDDAYALDRWLATFPLTDLGNVERFVQRQKGRLIYCPALGWFYWDGRRWSREGADGRANIAEHETVRAIQDEAAVIIGTDQDIVVGGTEKEPIMLSDRLMAWGRTSENASRLNPISKRAAPYLAVEPHQLDADPFKINLRNGTLVVRRTFTDLDSGWQSWPRVSESIRLKPHDPDDLITMISPVSWDGKAACPQYDDFMDLVQPSSGVQRFIDDWDGYSLTGDATEQVLVFHHGSGKNGKSTQIAVKLYIAGDYGRSIPIDTFAQEGRARQAGQATPDLAMLRRVRTLSTSEPQKGWRLDEALIKVLTGGDEVPVRELHKPYFMLRPEFKLGMNGNHKPRIDGGEAESGMWRRVKLVPWKLKIPKDQRDKHFGERLKAEAPGILNRMLRGLERWMTHGLPTIDEVEAATEQFRQESDPLGRFLEFCTRPSPDGRAQTSALHALYIAWARSFGEPEWKANGFGRAMTERGFISKKSDLNYWVGIETIKSVNDFVDRDGNPLQLEKAGSDVPQTTRDAGTLARSRRGEADEDERDGF